MCSVCFLLICVPSQNCLTHRPMYFKNVLFFTYVFVVLNGFCCKDFIVWVLGNHMYLIEQWPNSLIMWDAVKQGLHLFSFLLYFLCDSLWKEPFCFNMFIRPAQSQVNTFGMNWNTDCEPGLSLLNISVGPHSGLVCEWQEIPATRFWTIVERKPSSKSGGCFFIIN